MKISGFLSWWSLLKTTLSCFARYICVKCRGSLSRIRSKFRVFADYSTIFLFPRHELPANILSLLPLMGYCDLLW